MTPDDLLLHVYCLVDDELRAADLTNVRACGPEPTISDAEVITIELVGEFLSLGNDTALFGHFRCHHSDAFPALNKIHRTTFVRQAANLWKVKQFLHTRLAKLLVPDDTSWLVDSMPVYACKFGRARFCRRFFAQAAYGYDHAQRQTFYGFRLHFRTSREGVVLAVQLAPANASDLAVFPELNPPPDSFGFADRNYWSPELRAKLLETNTRLHTPFRSKSKDKDPVRSRLISKLRWLVETVLGQLAERFDIKRTKARDLWHFQHRIIRKVLSHTVAIHLCRAVGLPPLQFASLLAA